MAFPGNLTNAVDGITDVVAAHLNNLEDKVGIDGSLVTTSLDYLLKNPASVNPGHLHTPVAVGFGTPGSLLNMNGLNFIFYPDVHQFKGSFILSDGGSLISHTAGQEGWLNTFIGAHTGLLNTTGHENTFVGGYAGWHNVTGAGNVGVGSGALQANTASFNTVVGADCGLNNTTGSRNCFFGNMAGSMNLVGSYNSFFGYNAGGQNLASYNTFIGDNCGCRNTTGEKNTCIGQSAGGVNLTGNNNIHIGYYAGNYETGSNTFYLDSRDRGGLDAARSGALMWGTFNATTYLQNLTINAATLIYGKTINGLLLLAGGDNSSGANGYAQIKFGFNNTANYAHWIVSRHNGGATAGNALDFYTGDGTQSGVFPANSILGLTITNGGIAVGIATPHAAAKLHVSSTTRGFLPPVMTTTQKNAISTPPAGLVVYDSTLNKLCVYAGAAWETITSS